MPLARITEKALFTNEKSKKNFLKKAYLTVDQEKLPSELTASPELALQTVVTEYDLD